VNAKGCYRYYSTQRPIGIGCYPKPVGNKVLNIENFDERKKVPEISRKAWGYIEYEYPVDGDQLRAYELVKPEKLYMDRSTGEVVSRSEMLELFAELYDGGDETNAIDCQEYFVEV